MIILLIITGYVAVGLVYGWRLALRFKDKDIHEGLELRAYMLGENSIERAREAAYREAIDEANENLDIHLLSGFSVALFWPFTMPVRGLYRLVSEHDLMTTSTERVIAERRELERLRAQARELGLPMGDEK
jgi:hypothetical protein